jgi:hypothetical protein
VEEDGGGWRRMEDDWRIEKGGMMGWRREEGGQS